MPATEWYTHVSICPVALAYGDHSPQKGDQRWSQGLQYGTFIECTHCQARYKSASCYHGCVRQAESTLRDCMQL